MKEKTTLTDLILNLKPTKYLCPLCGERHEMMLQDMTLKEWMDRIEKARISFLPCRKAKVGYPQFKARERNSLNINPNTTNGELCKKIFFSINMIWKDMKVDINSNLIYIDKLIKTSESVGKNECKDCQYCNECIYCKQGEKGNHFDVHFKFGFEFSKEDFESILTKMGITAKNKCILALKNNKAILHGRGVSTEYTRMNLGCFPIIVGVNQEINLDKNQRYICIAKVKAGRGHIISQKNKTVIIPIKDIIGLKLLDYGKIMPITEIYFKGNYEISELLYNDSIIGRYHRENYKRYGADIPDKENGIKVINDIYINEFEEFYKIKIGVEEITIPILKIECMEMPQEISEYEKGTFLDNEEGYILMDIELHSSKNQNGIKIEKIHGINYYVNIINCFIMLDELSDEVGRKSDVKTNYKEILDLATSIRD